MAPVEVNHWTGVDVRVAPVGDAPAPQFYMSGTDDDIPIMAVLGGPFAETSVQVALGNHADPVDWLRTLAARANQMADQLAAEATYAEQVTR